MATFTKTKIMKNFDETLGIDLSKKTLDAYLHLAGEYAQFDNNPKGFRALLAWAFKMGGVKSENLLICFEHTGLYGMALAAYLEKKNLSFAMVPALEIKRSLGMVRGKNDRVDAKRIAQYAHMRRDTIEETKMPAAALQKMKQILALRERMVAQRAGYTTQLKELKRIYKPSENPSLYSVQEKLVRELTKAIDTLEAEIKTLIKSDGEVKRLFDLVTSVKGVGLVVGANIIVITRCFKIFKNSRQFACYCGVAPFQYQSGTSLKSKAKVSHYANKKMKALLNIAAFSAVQADKEIRTYYQRRVAEGKSKMSTMNIVRNKILHRVFAVVNRGTPFVETYRHQVNYC
jgi:transposase